MWTDMTDVEKAARNLSKKIFTAPGKDKHKDAPRGYVRLSFAARHKLLKGRLLTLLLQDMTAGENPAISDIE